MTKADAIFEAVAALAYCSEHVDLPGRARYRAASLALLGELGCDRAAASRLFLVARGAVRRFVEASNASGA